jgi:hypothetical protein
MFTKTKIIIVTTIAVLAAGQALAQQAYRPLPPNSAQTQDMNTGGNSAF